jgi:Fe2+ or Zn2+ uptake regulation protein
VEKRSEISGLWLDQRAFSAACRDAGLADTAQRRVIYRALAESSDHPTVEAVHRRVAERLARVSLATVYRNLKAFVDAGLVEEVAVGGHRSRFDANMLPHHHLICRVCGTVRDYLPGADHELGGEHAEAHAARIELGAAPRFIDGFEIDSAKINWIGICSPCASDRGRRTG